MSTKKEIKKELRWAKGWDVWVNKQKAKKSKKRQGIDNLEKNK